MKNIPQYLQVLARQKMYSKLKDLLDPGLIQKWAAEALNRHVLEALNIQMFKESDEFLGRQPYQNEAEPVHWNGFKTFFAPFLGGFLSLRQPILRRGGFVSPTLAAVRDAGKALVNFLASRMWLKGIGTKTYWIGVSRPTSSAW